MAIPDYERIMLPLLQLARDGKPHSLSEAVELLGNAFGLSEDERRELLPSGRQARFDNRVGWARTYLKKAGLLESTGRGTFRITERGLALLRENPPEITNELLFQFPEFKEFKSRQVSRLDSAAVQTRHSGGRVTSTPEEVLEASYQELRRELAQELLDRVKRCSPRFFEQLVVDVLVAMGYGGSRTDAGQAIGQTGDGGIDGIIKEDRLGLDVVYIQAKRWDRTVGRPEVQAFAGSLEGQRARKGVFITTSQFSQDARRYVEIIEKRIVLIDGEQLAQLMIDHGVGVTEVSHYVVRRIDLDYFGEGE